MVPQASEDTLLLPDARDVPRVAGHIPRLSDAALAEDEHQGHEHSQLQPFLLSHISLIGLFPFLVRRCNPSQSGHFQSAAGRTNDIIVRTFLRGLT